MQQQLGSQGKVFLNRAMQRAQLNRNPSNLGLNHCQVAAVGNADGVGRIGLP